MYRHRGSLDTHLLEHALKPEFWILGAFIIMFWIMTLAATARVSHLNQNHHSNLSDAQPSTGLASLDEISSQKSFTAAPILAPPKFTMWLAPYLVTRRRKGLALVVYLVILGAQLLEGYWVVVTLGRLTAKVFLLWPSNSWAYWVFS